MRGLPGPRFLLPSYFAATSSRYQRRIASGVTHDGSDIMKPLSTKCLPLHCQATLLGVAEPQPPAHQMLAKDPILRDKVLDYAHLTSVEPIGDGKHEELEHRGIHRPKVYLSTVPNSPRQRQPLAQYAPRNPMTNLPFQRIAFWYTTS